MQTMANTPAILQADEPFFFWSEDHEITSAEKMEDAIARIVMQRFRDGRQAKRNNSIFQGKCTAKLFREADLAMAKRFTCETEQLITAAFQRPPAGYYGLSYSKVIGIRDWAMDLLAGNLEAIVRVQPTPVPRLDRASVRKIKEGVKQELVAKMEAAGIGDPSQLISLDNGRLHDQVKAFLADRAAALRVVEQARLVSAAQAAGQVIQTEIRDLVVEGHLRTCYEAFKFNQLKYGISFIKWPHFERKIVLADNQDRKGQPTRQWKIVPGFRVPSPWNIVVTNDGRDLATNTAVLEYDEVNKITLVGLTADPRYNRAAIERLLEEYSMKSRSWLMPEQADSKSENGNPTTYWGPEELVPRLTHEGRVTGYDLHEQGLTGYEATAVYDIYCEIVLGHTIRLEVRNPLLVNPRSYGCVKFDSTGDGVWSAVGIPAILHDTEREVNIMLEQFRTNLDWNARPPMMANYEAFKYPEQAASIVPGGIYEVATEMTSAGTPPDPMRAMRGAGAQYQIIWPLVLQKIRIADEEVGVPQLALTGDQYGKGSLGEYASRVSNALRRIKAAAYSEDVALEPIWRGVFEHVVAEKPQLLDNVDLDLDFKGISGILSQSQEQAAKVQRLGLVMQGAQAGIVPKPVVDYAFQDALKSTGIPTEALGFGDPMIDQALAIAAANPLPMPNQNLVPQIDGRSSPAQAPGVTATPTGGSTALGSAPATVL